MPFAAEIVVRESARDGRAYAGFASQVPKGKTLQRFGSWYGSQMSYRPFNRAMSEARELAASINAAKTSQPAEERAP
jgi:hypothetical protein